ncbi:MAG: hypothetical protein ACRDNS_09635 [Trebonia sp.]
MSGDDRRIEFADAVPLRRDRRDLRRRFRRATRAAMSEQNAAMAAVLRRLSAEHVRLSGVIQAAQDRDRDRAKVVVFTDGTRLLLGIHGDDGLERLGHSYSRIWLADVQPCLGRRLFWLGFTSATHRVRVAVLASVAPVPAGSQDDRSW